MHGSGMAAPTPEEAAADAGRVELHSCRVCSAVTRQVLISARPELSAMFVKFPHAILQCVHVFLVTKL